MSGELRADFEGAFVEFDFNYTCDPFLGFSIYSISIKICFPLQSAASISPEYVC